MTWEEYSEVAEEHTGAGEGYMEAAEDTGAAGKYIEAADAAIYLSACMVKGEKPDRDRVLGMDLPNLYAVAKDHLLTGILGYALEEAGIEDPAFIQAKGKAIRKCVLFDAERRRVLEELEKAGIWHMPLKGSVLKEFYPRVGMRQMADQDILIDGERSLDVKHIMEGLGYRTEHYGTGVHDSYFKLPVLNFEMHRALFASSHDNNLEEYYKDVKKRLLKDEGNLFGYHFSPEDFYIYMVSHEYKHYMGGGTGLRSLLDTYVYLRNRTLNMDYVGREMEKLGIGDFERENRSLSLHLFEGIPLSEREKEMFFYVLSSGTYGTMANRVEMQLKKRGRLGYFFSRLTLPYDLMLQVYPVLAKAPILYPLCWAHRLIRAFFVRHKVVMYELRAVLRWRGNKG